MSESSSSHSHSHFHSHYLHSSHILFSSLYLIMTTSDSHIKKKQRVSTDDLYRRSSQFKLWSYTASQLGELRHQTNHNGQVEATHKFDQVYDTIKQQEANKAIFDQYGDGELKKESLLNVVELEEEMKYLNFYSKNIIQAANFFKMPTQVKATAVSFFKKFYLVNSVLQYHPKNVLYTCLFLAAKSENYFISIESFCKALQKTEPKDILDLEFVVLQSLRFTLMVHHPYRPLYGFFLDCQQVLLYPTPIIHDISIDNLGQLYDKAKKWLNDYALLSDVTFLFTPPQIALAAMYDTERRITEKYLRRKFLRSDHSLDTIGEGKEESPNGTSKNDKEESNNETNENGPEESSNNETTNDTNESPQNDSNETTETKHKPKTPQEEYELIIKTIRKCIKTAKELPETSREESTKIDRKCFFAINPEKLINKKLKKLTNPNTTPSVPDTKSTTPV